MMTRQAVAPHVGDVFVLPQADCLFGIGPVIARIVQVRQRVEFDAAPWWHVTASVANGTPEHHGRWLPRDLYIREASFPKTLQVPIV